MPAPLGWVALAAAFASGALIARHLLGERRPALWLVGGAGLGLLLVLLFGTYLYRWLDPAPFAWSCLVIWVGLVALLARRPAPDALRESLPWWAWLFLALGSAIVFVFAVFEQAVGMVVDGDFFVHVANIGLFANGQFPPRNPFLDVPMHGHYGRDLLLALLSSFSGASLLTTEWVATTAVQLITFALLFFWLHQATGSPLQAALGSGFGFFAANFGSRVGLVDTLANNNPVAFLTLVTASWAVFTALRNGRPAGWVVAGLFLGLDGVVYETHLGVLLMTLVLTSTRRFPRAVAVMLVTALLVACTAGGVLTEMAGRALGISQGEQSMAQQRVQLQVPKSALFQVRMNNLRPSRPFETKFRPWGVEWAASGDYKPIWGRDLLSVMWYPAWFLLPSLAFLAWRGSRPGLWLGCVGLFSLLVPAVVDFGFYEGEATRWLFVTAVGASAAFGLALGELVELSSGQGRVAALVGLAVVLWFNSPALTLAARDMARAYRNPGTPLPIGRPGVVPEAGFFPNPSRMLSHHYGVDEAERETALRLRELAQPEERFLADDFSRPANARGVLVGLAGIYPAGNEPPPEGSDNPDLYRQSPQVQAFWRTGDPGWLAPLGVDWLMLAPNRHAGGFWDTLKASPLVVAESERLYRLRFPPAPTQEALSLKVSGSVPPSAGPGGSVRVDLELEGEVKAPFWLGFEVGPTRLLLLVPEGRTPEVVLPVPEQTGPVTVRVRPGGLGDGGWQVLGEVEVTSPESGRLPRAVSWDRRAWR